MRVPFGSCLMDTGLFSLLGFAGNSSQSFNCRRQCRECFYFLGSNEGGNWWRGGRHFFCKELVWLWLIRFVNSCFGSRTLCTEFRVKGRYPYGLKLIVSESQRQGADNIFWYFCRYQMILALSSLWLLCSEARKCFWLYLLWWKTRQQPQWIRTLVIRKSGNPKVQMTCGCVLMRWVFVCCLVTGPFSFPGFAGNSSQSFNCRRQCRECFYFLGSNEGGNWWRGGRHFFCKELVWLWLIRFVNSCFGSRTLCTEFRVKGRYPYGLKLIVSESQRQGADNIFWYFCRYQMILALSSLWLLCSEARKCFWLYLLWWKTRPQPQWIRSLVIRKSGNPKVQMTCGRVLMRWVFVWKGHCFGKRRVHRFRLRLMHRFGIPHHHHHHHHHRHRQRQRQRQRRQQ